jgi:hypothetical protein
LGHLLQHPDCLGQSQAGEELPARRYLEGLVGMNEVHFVQESTYGTLPGQEHPEGLLTSSASESVIQGVALEQRHLEGGDSLFPKIPVVLSILAPKQIKQLFGCERIEVEVPSVELKFEAGLVQTMDEALGRGYQMPNSRVTKLKTGKYQVNLKRWQPIVKFEMAAPAFKWPRIAAALLWLARKAGMRSPTKVDIHCGPVDTHTLQVKYQ